MKAKKERNPKISTKVIRGKVKAVRTYVDDEPVVNVVKVTSNKPPSTTYLTSQPNSATKGDALQSVRAHSTEQGALRRFKGITRRFPQITPRVKKLL